MSQETGVTVRNDQNTMSNLKEETDIRVENGELIFGYEDIELVQGEYSLLQDIKSKLYTDLGALFYAPRYGAKVLRFIHQTVDDMTLLELKQAIKISLKSDDRINSNSIVINIAFKDQELIINIDFKTEEGQNLNLDLKI